MSERVAGTARVDYRQNMSRPERSLRQQLLEARAKIQRQIEILAAGPASLGSSGSFIDSGDSIAELKAVLGEIEESLADVGLDSQTPNQNRAP